jgi:hypothetical protein
VNIPVGGEKTDYTRTIEPKNNTKKNSENNFTESSGERDSAAAHKIIIPNA